MADRTTEALDAIRMTGGYTPEGTKLSRSEARSLLVLIAKATGSDVEEYIEMIAQYYEDNKQSIEEQAFHDRMTC